MWPEPFASILAFGSLLHFDLNMLSPSSAVSSSALMSYGMTVSGFVLVLARIIRIHCVSVLVFHGGKCDTVTQNVAALNETLFSNIWDTGGAFRNTDRVETAM